jgi:WXG100 family type VII secretion target
MTQFQVDSEQVLAANTAIQSTIGRVQSDISALHAQMQSLQDSWRGLAANQFQELALRWHTTANLARLLPTRLSNTKKSKTPTCGYSQAS